MNFYCIVELEMDHEDGCEIYYVLIKNTGISMKSKACE